MNPPIDAAVPRPLPPALAGLAELALDLSWTWNHANDDLWAAVDAPLWAQMRHPWLLLQAVAEQRLHTLAGDRAFLERLATALAEQQERLTRPSYFAAPPQVAYFCLEYGIAEVLPLYSGGLGVLAGDTLKTASDLGLPLVAVGLLYQHGFARQMIDSDGVQREFYPANMASDLPIAPARLADGQWLHLPLKLPGRILTVRVWQARVGRVPLLLLDTSHPLNTPADRGITGTLYPTAPATRFEQEVVLGIGGWRALTALGYQPQVCHLNEGHAALATLERARQLMHAEHLDFEQALWATRASNIFTTHTSVAAAFDAYPIDMVRRYGRVYAADLGVDEQALAALGQLRPQSDDDHFNLAYLALRCCGAVNGVSRRHGEVSRQLFAPLFPRRPAHEVPVSHVTNGIHVASWDSPNADALWTAACGKDRWRGDLETVAAAIDRVDDLALWTAIGADRLRLVHQLRERLVQQLEQRGSDAASLDLAAHALDPNALTLGFARRFTAYKRPNLLLRDPERLQSLLRSKERPLQLIIAGKAHPQDDEGRRLIQEWTRFLARPGLRARVVFVEDYDLNIAQQLVQGVDVWLNTPRRPWEACGTSGMKVLVNGGLNVSVLDGWWAEAWSADVGWSICADVASGAQTDALEAEQLYRCLEDEVIPLFYQRDAEGLPRAWLARIRQSLATLTPRFSSNRMLDDYVQRLYQPAAAAGARRLADQTAVARALRDWQAQLKAGWRQIHFGRYEHRSDGGDWVVDLQVYLGEIPEDAVRVQLYAEPRDAAAPEPWAMQRGQPIEGALNAWHYSARVPADRPIEHYTPRVLPWHPEAIVPLESALVRWWPG